MVGFRNTVGTAPIANWVSPQSSQIAFGRGVFYHLPRRRSRTNLRHSLEAPRGLSLSTTLTLHGVQPLRPCYRLGPTVTLLVDNAHQGAAPAHRMALESYGGFGLTTFPHRYTVSGGAFSAVVPARGAIAIHTGALGSLNPQFSS